VELVRTPSDAATQTGAVDELERALAARFPTLHVLVIDGRVHIKGTLAITNGTADIDRFAVDVVLSPDHPHALPQVFETAGRIPRTMDRHMNGDGSACIVMPDAFWLEHPTRDIDIVEYLGGPVHSYFLGQAAVERGEPWPFGEWAHGGAGVMELYGRLLGTREAARVRDLLLAVLRPSVKALRCPCGSGRRLRKCHGELVRVLKKRIPPAVAEAAIAQLAHT
jgi:hypothetical protein